MRHIFSAIAVSLAALPAFAQTDAPVVIVDTVPLHSLVARVMVGIGTPKLLLPPGTSPHDFQLRPSDAARLTTATVVIWTGEGLAPWLAEPLATLAPEAVTLEVLETDGWTALPVREDAAFVPAEDHEGEANADEAVEEQTEAEGEEHAEDEGADHAHEERDGAEHVDAAADNHKDHDHSGTDPHAWLDPAVAAVWLTRIASTLATADPGNAALYEANAIEGAAELVALQAELTAILAPVAGRPYIVPHDAYQYFELAFGMPAAGAIALSDAATPGPARIAALRERVVASEVTCILTDPQTSPAWTDVLAEGAGVNTAMVDPDGTGYAPGPDLYPAMMRDMTRAIAGCLADPG